MGVYDSSHFVFGDGADGLRWRWHMSDWLWIGVLAVTVIGAEIRFATVKRRLQALEKRLGLPAASGDPL